MDRKIAVDGEHLSIGSVVDAARTGASILLDGDVRNKIAKSREYVEKAVEQVVNPDTPEILRKNRLIYGVTTGFGSHKEFIIKDRAEAKNLQTNILMSHACGVGSPFEPDVVRAIMLIRLNSFAKGFSGVRYELLEILSEMLNHGIHPLVPQQGSVGSSGDLCPLSHLALVLIGKGKASVDRLSAETRRWIRGRIVAGKAAMDHIRSVLAEKGISVPFELGYKEGLALTNGTTVMTAIGVLVYHDALNLIKHADIAGAMTLEAVGGRTRAFDSKVHDVRPFTGQRQCADNVRKLIAGSQLVDRNGDVQDAYSVRCIPQVHGAVKDALDHVRQVLEVEINSATDNPLFFEPNPPPSDGFSEKWDYSAGNFHGEPIALAMDYLGLAVAEIGSIAERRIQKLLDKHHNYGLPSNLTPDPRVHSGLMLSHYTAASLVSENKVLCHPASCDSIPTSANIEDHVSMGTVAARKARTILENVEYILAVELLCASQALDFRAGTLGKTSDISFRGKPGKGTQTAYEKVRETGLRPVEKDRELSSDIEKAKNLIEGGTLVEAVENAVAELYKPQRQRLKFN